MTGQKYELIKNTNVLLIGIVLIAIVSRLFNLTYQSYWYDELYIMDVSNPIHSVSDILEAMKVEFHPPLHFFGIRYFFKVFGYTDFTGRLFSAIIGVCGIIAMYFFGIEIKNKRIGLFMALVTTANYYHLYHSQEVRMYITLFLLTTISSIFLLRILKKNSLINYSFFVLFAALNLYTHYFAIFVFGAQVLFLLNVNLIRREKKFLWESIASIVVISLLYLPWIPYILRTSGKSHWMTIPDFWYFFDYLYNLLGKDPVSYVIFLLGIFLFIRNIVIGKLQNNPYQRLTGYYLCYSLFSIYVLTYFVSFFKPILLLRCTIAALPFLIAVVVSGVDQLKMKASNIVIAILVVSSVINILFINKYYYRLTKADFRGVVEIVKKRQDSKLFLSSYAQYYDYYFGQFGVENKVLNPIGEPEDIFNDSKIFYILNAHNDSNIMTMQKYSSIANYIDNNFRIDTVFYTFSRTENLVKYCRKENH